MSYTVLKIDVKNKQSEYVQEDFILPANVGLPKGINLDKLKQKLKAKGIISDESEIE